MDVACLALAGLFWIVVLGLSLACARLQPTGGRP
jgi:hypothetical protein